MAIQKVIWLIFWKLNSRLIANSTKVLWRQTIYLIHVDKIGDFQGKRSSDLRHFLFSFILWEITNKQVNGYLLLQAHDVTILRQGSKRSSFPSAFVKWKRQLYFYTKIKFSGYIRRDIKNKTLNNLVSRK